MAAGTTLADLFDRSLGVGCVGGSSILSVMLMATLALWHRPLGSVAVASVTSPKAEMLYWATTMWATIMVSQTLGTLLCDWTADTTGLGYEGGALVFAAAFAAVAAARFYTGVSRTLLFWAACILAMPQRAGNHPGPQEQHP